MSTITLYDCPRLHARITLAACEANRAKRDIMQAQCEWKEPGVRPYPCRTCTDWQAWTHQKTQEALVSTKATKKADLPPFVCPNCHATTRHYSLGLCRHCYRKQYYANKENKQAVPAEPSAPVAEQVAPSAPVVAQVAPDSLNRRIYLATPYTAPDASVMEQRCAAATSAANTLIRQGHNVFSPISHGAEVGRGLPPDFAFWSTSCLSFVKHWATDVYVLMLPGWEASVGVSAEMEAAKALNIPVTHILPMPCNHDLPLAV